MLDEIIFRSFKSFADEQVMKFEKGINGIIGPNGCGKSNIIDGISFVLGAQSAKNLRGGKMQDVIFAGSSTRKPKDQAEVTLILDNRSGSFKKAKNSQVSVTRRVFRTGGSEYYIDNEPVRLKDVHDLFMDTGVGSDSYSIIGQGQIGKILSTKLDERRAIFEEAAGIVKLKHQKEQTEKRLKEVDGNMLRIEDIVKEIEKQLNPLKRQSEKALEFKVHNDELQSLEVQYLLHEYDSLETKITETKITVDSLRSKIEEAVFVLNEKESGLANSKVEFQEKNDALFNLQSEFSTNKEEFEKLKGSIVLNKERIENARKLIKEANENLKEIEDKHSLSTEEFKNKHLRLDEIVSVLKEFEEKINLINEEISTNEIEKLTITNEIEYTRKKSVDEYNEMNKKKYELEQTNKIVMDVSTQLDEFKEKNKREKAEKKDLEKTTTDTKNAYISLLNSYKENETHYISKQTELKDIRTNYSKTILKKQDTEANWFRLKNQVENLENFIEKNEGFYDGVKSVLNEKKKGNFSGVLGAVAEVINVDKRFEIALDGLLQSSMQFLITENDQVAKEAVNFLKREKKGRATFLPLNLANPYSFDKKELKLIAEAPGIHLAIDAISFSGEFEPIMLSLLGRSVIADNLDIALSFIKEKKVRAKVSTLDGEIVQSGSISGGHSKNQKTNFFAKRRELDEIKKQYDEADILLNDYINEEINTKEKIETYEETIKVSLVAVDDIRLQMHQKQKENEDAIYNLERYIERTQELLVLEKELKNELNEAKKKISTLTSSVDMNEKHYNEMNASITELEAKSIDYDKELNELKENKTNYFLSVTRLNEEERQIRSYLDDVNNDNDSIEEKIEKLYNRKETESNRIVELEEHEKSLEKQVDITMRKLGELNTLVEDMRSSNQELSKSIDVTEIMIKNERAEKELLEKELNQKEIYYSKRETEKTNTLSRLKETYQIEEETVGSLDRVEIDFVTSKKTITELKRKISLLGNINHAAVEEYEVLEKRYKDERDQLSDVKTAKTDLNMLIANVENEMVARFTTSFDSIAEKFAVTFVELFEGGKAKLTLEDPNEPLTSAIEIIAQPPGKKPASINSLSGGEKSFTAVALIFAIILSNPSPFVILDEVDAPLDDANVARFARQLNKYRDMSQFVVITHRKGTMMSCDTITGITQEERGVSIVFPHTLEDKDKLLS